MPIELSVIKSKEMQGIIVKKFNKVFANIQKSPDEMRIYRKFVSELRKQDIYEDYDIQECNESQYIKAFSESSTLYKKYYNKDMYAPRIDVGVCPTVLVNGRPTPAGLLLSTVGSEGETSKWQEYLRAFFDVSKVWKKIKYIFFEQQCSIGNQNPVYILGVEIENSSAMKYLIGDFFNATILAKIGIVAVNEKLKKSGESLIKYIEKVEEIRKVEDKKASYFINQSNLMLCDDLIKKIDKLGNNEAPENS